MLNFRKRTAWNKLAEDTSQVRICSNQELVRSPQGGQVAVYVRFLRYSASAAV